MYVEETPVHEIGNRETPKLFRALSEWRKETAPTDTKPNIRKALSEFYGILETSVYQYTTKDLPFIVIGYGNGDEEEHNLAPIELASIHTQDKQYADVSLDKIQTKKVDLKYAEIPWSVEKMVVDELDTEVVLTLPRNTQIIGRVSNEACLAKHSSYKVLHFEYGKTVSNLRNISGIIYPTELPETDAYPCSHVCKEVSSPFVHSKHYVHTGICLAESTKWRSRRSRIRGNTGDVFLSLLNNHKLISKCDPSNNIHAPYKFKKLPKKIEELLDTDKLAVGIKIKVKFPFLLVSILLLALPGIAQYCGSKDNDWGDIVNEIIGTGSVLLGFFNIVFLRWFNSEIWARGKLRDINLFTTTNDWVAKTFAPQAVREIEDMVCDPNIPAGLIAKDRNSAVRAVRNGWLSAGNRIPFTSLSNHGYVVFKEKSMVLDLVQGKFYHIYKKGVSAKIIRNIVDYDPALVIPLDGNEVFEIPCKRKWKKKVVKCCCGNTNSKE